MNDTNVASLPKDVNQENKKRLHLLILCIFSILIIGIVLYGCFTPAYTYRENGYSFYRFDIFHVISYNLKDNIDNISLEEKFIYSMAVIAFVGALISSILHIIFMNQSIINPKKNPFKNTFLIAAISCYIAMYLALTYALSYQTKIFNEDTRFTFAKTPYILLAFSAIFIFYQAYIKYFINKQPLEKNRFMSSIFLDSAAILTFISAFLTFTNVMYYKKGGQNEAIYLNISYALQNSSIKELFENNIKDLLSFDYYFYFFAILIAIYGAIQTLFQPTNKRLWDKLSFYIGSGCLILYHLFLIICILSNTSKELLSIHYQAIIAGCISVVALALYLVGDLVFKRKIKESFVELQ